MIKLLDILKEISTDTTNKSMQLDDLKYGNPTKELYDKVKNDKAGVLKACLDNGIVEDILKNHQFPPNSSQKTKTELEYLVKINKEATEQDIRFCEIMESIHYKFFEVVGKKLGLDVNEKQIEDWCSDIDPVLFYLKDQFNRPRPYQLAKELEMELYPITATDASSAAYPSGHTLDFLVILYHFAKMKPDAADEINDFYHKIKRVRELSGLHYPSDRKVSEYLFKQLVKNKLISNFVIS